VKGKILGAVKKLKKDNKLIKLNLGCGTDYKEGWLNIDNNSDNNIDRLDLNWDLRNPLPYKPNSVDYIFNEHFFEHLTPSEALTSMKDCRRVLKSGGIMRIAMPDLEQIVDAYLNVPLSEDPVIKRHGFTFIKTKAEWMNMSFREWGHKWIYDFEELERRLKEAGFKSIKRYEAGKSTTLELRNLETRPESYLVVEATK
jgi:predicted SAM-dependent methyltransferase